MGIRRTTAIITAKVFSRACRLAGKQGTTMAGKLAMRMDPSILKDLAAQVRRKIFVVCGTNGKTTTNNLICSALEAEGAKVVCNRLGANMLIGVTAAFVQAASPGGKLDADYACIEVDEASAQRIFPYFKPDYMVITNLFRDQLDRYGEIDTTIDLLKKAIDLDENLTLGRLAKEVGYSEYHLSRKFKEETGENIRDYIKYARIERARILLSTTDLSIREIAEQLCFCASSHFAKVFYDVTGLLPQQYRNEAYK